MYAELMLHYSIHSQIKFLIAVCVFSFIFINFWNSYKQICLKRSLLVCQFLYKQFAPLSNTIFKIIINLRFISF
jgi:hypothetical protein